MSDDRPEPSGLPDLAALVGGAGEGDNPFAGLLERAQNVVQAQAAAAEREVEGVAGGGAVRIVATGTGDVRAVRIRPDAVDPDDVEVLEDLVLAALHDLNARLAEVQREALGGLGGLLGGGIPGFE
ncbi:MAG: YbaB/EbfC family nucleoid-associated protein [Acidimicrobiia bacterium]